MSLARKAGHLLGASALLATSLCAGDIHATHEYGSLSDLLWSEKRHYAKCVHTNDTELCAILIQDPEQLYPEVVVRDFFMVYPFESRYPHPESVLFAKGRVLPDGKAAMEYEASESPRLRARIDRLVRSTIKGYARGE